VNAPRSWPNSSLSIRVGLIAPQSTVTNGAWALLLAAWIARAAISLPEPVSPQIHDREVRGATAASMPNRSRMTWLRPTRSPKLSCADGCTRIQRSLGRKTTSVRPTWMSAPGASTASSTSVPFTRVPFVLPRSRITYFSPTTETSKWRRDT